MTIEYRDGDLFAQDDLGGIGHGCNTKGQMGAGIAKTFRERYPEMYHQYVMQCEVGLFMVGHCFPWSTGSGYPSTIFNLATQDLPGPHAHLPWVTSAIGQMLWQAHNLGLTTVGIPEIGCGIGGLRWDDVAEILDSYDKVSYVDKIVVVRYKP